MSRGRQKVSFEGLLQENVLGTFKIIRGFADLRDLADVSVAMPYQGSKDGEGTGYQRQHDEQHVEDIKRFLSRGRYRFLLAAAEQTQKGRRCPLSISDLDIGIHGCRFFQSA